MNEFWEWFADSLKNVADRAYHMGWHDGEWNALNPETTLPPEDIQREWYTKDGFEPEYVANLYKSAPLGFTREDATAIRLCVEICDVWITRDDTLALWQKNRPSVLSIADRIESLLPPEK